MKLGKAAMEALQAEICGRLLPGNELVVAGAVALKGTALIAKEKNETLREHFSQRFLYDSENLQKDYGVGDTPEKSAAWKTAEKAGATALYAMGEGGFLSALWKMAEASQVGLEMDFTRIPVRQETIEICEIFDVNPFRSFAVWELWHLLLDKRTAEMTECCIIMEMADIWKDLLRMKFTKYCLDIREGNCINRRLQNGNIKYCTSRAGDSGKYRKYRTYLCGNGNTSSSD